MTVDGPNFAAQAFKAGLVDDGHLFVAPVLVGDGTRAFPSGVRLALVLQDERQVRAKPIRLRTR